MSREPKTEFIRLFASISSAEVQLDRNAKEYQISFQSRAGFPSDFGALQAKRLLTAGSQWSPAFGWTSYFGFPFAHKKKTLFVIGMESYPRSQTNGSHLATTCFIFELPIRPEFISNLVTWRECFHSPLATRRKLVRQAFQDLSVADSSSPAEHTVVEGWVIDQAIDAYRNDRQIYWRTLAFVHDHFVNSSTAKKRLLVTVPALLAFGPAEFCRYMPKLEKFVGAP